MPIILRINGATRIAIDSRSANKMDLLGLLVSAKLLVGTPTTLASQVVVRL